MISKSFIAATALTASVAAFAPAQAGVHVDVNIGAVGVYPGYAYYPYAYPNRHTLSCRYGADILRRHNFRYVQPVDCRLPGYRYVAWKHGKRFVIRLSGNGYITDIYRTY